jgi:hypothetical protein
VRNTTADRNASEAPRGAWNRFWFLPTDPTTLGFMRIMTGLLVIYVHLAYVFDFQAFFGANGYWDLQAANAERYQSPVGIPDWFDESRTDPNYPMAITTPQIIDRRVAVMDFLKHLPENKAKRDEALQYLYAMLDQNSQRGPMSDTAYAQARDLLRNAAPLLGEDRERIEAELRKDDLNHSTLQFTLPDAFSQMTAPERLRRWRDVQNLMEYMPAPKDNFDYVLQWLSELSAPERANLHRFLTRLPDGPASRERIEYLETWRQDEEATYAKGRYLFSVWFHATNPTTMWIIHFAFLGVFVLFTIGLWTRVTSVLSWLAALCYIHRSQQVLFGMDTIMNVLLFYLMIGPSGAALSVDRLRERYRASRALLQGKSAQAWAEAALRGPRASSMANFAVRLIQIHFCFIYAASGLAKLKGNTWWNTTAAWSTFANPEFCPPMQYPIYERFLFYLASFKPALAAVMMGVVYFTLILEISLPFLIWSRLRPLLICGSVMLHSAIACVMGLTCFGLLMFVMLLGYVPAAVIRDRLTWRATNRLTVRYNARDERHQRAVSVLRAFDLAHQLDLKPDENVANRDNPLLITGADQQTYSDTEGALVAIRSLAFGKSIAWLFWIPGATFLLRRVIGESASVEAPAPNRGPNVKSPVAGS